MGPFGRGEVPGVLNQRRSSRTSVTMAAMRGRRDAGVLALAVVLAACGGRPAELVPPIGKTEALDPDSPFPKLRFADGMLSINDRCPVTKRKLSIHFPPVYVNGQPIGFC